MNIVEMLLWLPVVLMVFIPCAAFVSLICDAIRGSKK
ncbi:hypothetical protein HMPREF1092_03081 [Clostridium thermobutyricum]|uniref:Uncharacterized protein n=2 Tax=Clostridium thermobutyricum TaxID=29372 RepID=N9WAL7_9CLOT|nr:hypothetical protein HMPREF1092_03081 [Clostridium thermobutyricum]OPX49743.1 hypothetical protein CLTHE_04740 [Clostridium thermobutyricum DSM 4928]